MAGKHAMRLIQYNSCVRGALFAVLGILLSNCSGDARPLEEAVEAIDLDLVSLAIVAPANSVTPLFVNSGTQTQFTLTGVTSSGQTVAVPRFNRRWTLDDSSVASISTDGLFNAIAPSAGPITVGVRVAGFRAQYELTIADGALTTITSIEGDNSLRRCDPASYFAKGMFNDAFSSTRNVADATWAIAPTDVARLGDGQDGSIFVVGLNPGTATLTANVETITFSREIEIGTELQSIAIAPEGPSVAVNGNNDLEAVGSYLVGENLTSINITASVDWQIIEGADFVSVQNSGDNKGQLTGIAEGVALVQAACGATQVAESVTITAATSGLVFKQDSPLNVLLSDPEQQLNVSTGEGYSLENDVTDESDWEVISGSDVLSVENSGSDKGEITALAAGSATVRATYNDESVSISIRVIE